MRLLAALVTALTLVGPAAASTPRFGIWDLQTDLAKASRNGFGDVAVKSRAALAGKGTLVRCGASCRFGSGWLAFRGKPQLGAGDVRSVSVAYSKRHGWTVSARLTRPALSRWIHFAQVTAERSQRRGVPDVLVVAAGGVVAAAPYSSTVRASRDRLVLTGFSRASANAVSHLLSRR